MDFNRITSDGTPDGTRLRAPEERAIPGEELWWPPGATTASAGVVITERTAIQSAPVLAAHITIATDVGITPLNVCQRMADDTHRVAVDHPLTPILRRSPDGRTTPSRFRAALIGHALAYGSGYAEIVRRGDGRPVSIHLCDPRSTRPQDAPDRRAGYAVGNQWLPAADVLHIAGFGFDGIEGYNLIRLMRQSIGVALGSESYAADFFANGADPGGAVEMPGTFETKEKLQRFREGLEDRHQGPGKRHRVAVITQGGKWVKTGAEPDKAQLIETRRYQAIDVVRPWRVPPHKIGDYSQAHLANVGAANLDYLMTTLLGWFVAIEEEFSLKLLSEAEWRAGYHLEHDLTTLLRGDVLTRYQCHEIGVRNGWASRNDVRRIEGQNPIPPEKGGDLYTIQAQVIPLSQAGKPFDPTGQAAKPTDGGQTQ